jgi:hypothetical protein
LYDIRVCHESLINNSIDIWIITPREKVETLIKRVPHWRDQGATIQVCEDNLQTIGYPDYLIDIYLRPTYERG